MVSRIENLYKNLDKRFYAKILLIVIPIICLWQITPVSIYDEI